MYLVHVTHLYISKDIETLFIIYVFVKGGKGDTLKDL